MSLVSLSSSPARHAFDYRYPRSQISQSFVRHHNIPHIGTWVRTTVTISRNYGALSTPFDFVSAPDIPPGTDVVFGADFHQRCEVSGWVDILQHYASITTTTTAPPPFPRSYALPPGPSSSPASSAFAANANQDNVLSLTTSMAAPSGFSYLPKPVSPPGDVSGTVAYRYPVESASVPSSSMIPVAYNDIPSSVSIMESVLTGNGRTGVRCSVFLDDVAPLVALASLHGIQAAGFADASRITLALLHHIFTGMCTVSKHVTEGCRLLGREFSDKSSQSIAAAAALAPREVEYLLKAIKAVGIDIDGARALNQGRPYLIRRLREFSLSLKNSDSDIASKTLRDTFHNFDRLSLPVLVSTAFAHGIKVSRFTGTASEIRQEILAHFVHGTCFNQGGGAGCTMMKDVYSDEVLDDAKQLEILKDINERLPPTLIKRVLKILGVNKPYTLSNAKDVLAEHIQEIGTQDNTERDNPHSSDDLNNDWPPDLSHEFKMSLVEQFKHATSSEALKQFTCAICSENVPIVDQVILTSSTTDLSPLKRPDKRPKRPDEPDIVVDPFWLNSANDAAYETLEGNSLRDLVLDECGVVMTGNETRLKVCTPCNRHLKKGKVPPLSLANHMLLGDVPEELKDLTVVEEAMIARVRAKVWVIQFKEDRLTGENDDARDTARDTGGVQGNLDRLRSKRQKGFKGHIMVYPQDPGKVATILPPSVEELTSPICVLFIGSKKPSEEWLKTKAKPLYVRAHKVRAALVWLKHNNPLYSSITIDHAAMSSWPDEFVLPVHIEVTPPNDDLDVLTSRYDMYDIPGPEGVTSDSIDDLPYPFQSIVIADIDMNASAYDLKAAAIRHVIEKGNAYYEHVHGPQPVNEFYNPELFPMMYPTLFPYGIGGFENVNRSIRVSLERQVKHLFRLRDRRFQEHYSFLFTAFNMLQRREILRRTSYKVKQSSFATFAQRASAIDIETVTGVVNKLAINSSTTGFAREEQEVVNLMREVNTVTCNVPGSSASKAMMRREIRGLQIAHGLPTFFITINPADTFNPVVRFLAGEDFDVDNFLSDHGPNYNRDCAMIAKNPYLGATFFDLYMRNFIRFLLGYDTKGRTGGQGLFGIVKSYYGTVENQGRGSLHCHMLVWCEGACNTNQIRERVTQFNDLAFKERLIKFMDDAICTSLPENPSTHITVPSDVLSPVSVRGVPNHLLSLDGDLPEKKDFFNLVKNCQTHDHKPTCYKYWKKGSGKPKVCRFELAEFRKIVPVTTVDDDTGELTLRHIDPLINNYNPYILRALRCNMDIKFVGSGGAAKALTHYVTDYITKSQLKAHVAYGTMETAMKRVNEKRSDLESTASVGKALLQKCSFALVARQELSGQQVMSYLMGYGDHYTSHEYRSFYWKSIETFVNTMHPSPECYPGLPQAGGATSIIENPGNNVVLGANAPDSNSDVSIRLDDDGSISKRGSLLDDYLWRDLALNNLALWDMLISFEKVRLPRSQQSPQNDVDDFSEGMEDAGNLDMDVEEEDEDEDLDFTTLLTDKGRLRPKYQFLSSHPSVQGHHVDRLTHCLQLRHPIRRFVPVPMGETLPRRDRDDVYPRYCRLMLIFFKPWRSGSDLRREGQSWIEAFDEFIQECSPHHKLLMNNMQLQHECKDSRDDHFADRQSGHRYRSRTTMTSNTVDDDMCFDAEQLADHLDSVHGARSVRDAVISASVDQCVRMMANAGFIDPDVNLSPETDPSTPTPAHQLVSAADEEREAEWNLHYDMCRKIWRQNASAKPALPVDSHPASLADTMDVDGYSGGIAEGTSGLSESADIPVRESGIRQDVAAPPPSTKISVAEFLQTYEPRLNREQRRAFSIIAEHSLKSRPSPLRMFLGGPGGTGKSHVIHAVRAFFESQYQARRFRLSSYTGVAAKNICGMTLHSCLCMSQNTKESLNSSSDLVAMWEGVDYLFIDEVSMIGCHFMLAISKALANAKGNSLPFGGINVIFAGDFAQLPPVLDKRLYGKIKSERIGTASGQDAVYGKLLWMSVDTVVVLSVQMRQSGPENAEFANLLSRLRIGQCTDEDYNALQQRLVSRVNPDPVDNRWGSAPIIVSSNRMKDELNKHFARSFARKTGQKLHWYYATDSHGRSEVTDPRVLNQLAKLDSGRTSQRLYKIPLVIGMPVIVGYNFDIQRGVVNGCTGTLRHVRFRYDSLGRRHATSCIVDAPSTLSSQSDSLPHLTAGQVVALETKVSIKIIHPDTNKRATFSRLQVPILPGFAMTTHKSQGQTLSHAIVDLADCKGTEEPYVMLSRVTSMQGLLILRPFPKGKIMSRPSEDSRAEMHRINFLRLKTLLAHGDEDEKQAASSELSSLHLHHGSLSHISVNPHGNTDHRTLATTVDALDAETDLISQAHDREVTQTRKRPIQSNGAEPAPKRIRYSKVPLPPRVSMASIKDYMSNTVDDPVFRARIEPNGPLHRLPSIIEALGDKWAGAASVEELTTINQPNTFSRNYFNVDTNGEEKVFMYIGEILGFEQGTALAPFGNFSIPENGNAKPMTDDNTVKQIIVLGPPTLGDEYVQGCFTNQVVALHEAITEEGEAEMNAKEGFASIRHPYKHIVAGDNSPPDALVFHTERLYEIPPALRGIQVDTSGSSNTKGKAPKFERVSLKRPQPGSDNADKATPGTDNVNEPSASKESGQAPAKKIAVGDYIDPMLLPGYGGPLCALSKAQCVVMDVSDAAGQLALPPDYYKVIVPGALVWLSAVLKAWIYIDKDKNVKRKYYHLCITSIDIIDSSPFPPIRPEVRLVNRPVADLPSPRKKDPGHSAMRSLLRPVVAPASPSGSSTATASSDDVEMGENSSTKVAKPAKQQRRK